MNCQVVWRCKPKKNKKITENALTENKNSVQKLGTLEKFTDENCRKVITIRMVTYSLKHANYRLANDEELNYWDGIITYEDFKSSCFCKCVSVVRELCFFCVFFLLLFIFQFEHDCTKSTVKKLFKITSFFSSQNWKRCQHTQVMNAVIF